MHKEKGTKATVVLVYLFFQHTPYVQGTYLFIFFFISTVFFYFTCF